MKNETRPTGTQAIKRSIHLMKLLSTRGTFGWGLTDLARRSGLDKATVHRILACLESERLVHRDGREHRYFPGPMLVEMGLSVSLYQPLVDEGKAAALRLSQSTGRVGFFYLRSGDDFVVAARAEQSAQRGMLNEVGFRRPMIMSAGGVAMLVAMAPEERSEVVQRNLVEIAEIGIPKPERFLRMLERSVTLGYSANLEDVVGGIHSFGIPLRDAAGAPIGSVSLAGVTEHLPASAADKVVQLLARETAELAARAAKVPGHGGATAVPLLVSSWQEAPEDAWTAADAGAATGRPTAAARSAAPLMQPRQPFEHLRRAVNGVEV
jgi:DNA-binding IclR family transcriptional regulator